MNFRTDINGLRAIAVLLVVLFHFSVPGFNGGFIGVDVFFVISGFLMTQIIFSRIDKQTFSVVDFYLARAKRIIPALLALCLCLLVIHWFIMTPTEYAVLGKQISAASLFLSNILFWRGSGYFDSDAHEKWLLHTWSLSVEWQFYILYPIALLILIKMIGRKNISIYLFIAAGLSYLLSSFLPIRWHDAGFFLLPTRAWEMLAGGLIFLFPLSFSKRQSFFLETLGLILILSSGFFLSPSVRWPGWLAIFPVLGSVLLLYANRQTSLITNNGLAQHLGKISYSLYLWHWPVVVSLYYFELQTNYYFVIAGIMLSWVLAIISYYLVESPIRHWQFKNANGKSLFVYALISLVVFTIAISIPMNKGVPSRLDPIIVMADEERLNRNLRENCNMTPSETLQWHRCIYGDDKKVALIVAGDSHSNSVITAAAASIPTDKGGAMFLGADACSFIENISTTYFPNCAKYNQKNIEWLKSNLINTPILIVNRTTSALFDSNENKNEHNSIMGYIGNVPNSSPDYVDLVIKNYTSMICELSKYHPVYILQPIPEMDVNVPDQLIRNYRFHHKKDDISISLNSYQERHQKTKKVHTDIAQLCGAKLLDPVSVLCDANQCYGSMNGRSLYFDDDHLSEFGNRRLIPLIQTIWKN